MKTAVLIQAHKNENYIKSLALHNKEVRFYVHMDAKFPEKKKWLESQKMDNLILVDKTISVHWGGSSQIFATLKLMELAFSDMRNEFFHLISSECLALKEFSVIENEWMQDPDMQFIESHYDASNSWRLKVRVPHSDTRFLRTFIGRCINKLFKISTFFYDGVKIDPRYHYFGSQWFSVTRRFVGEVLDEKNNAFFESFRNITCADEHAFAIFARMNFSDSKNIKDSNKRFILFNGKASPEYLDINCINNLKSMDNIWFSRKYKEPTLLKLTHGDD